MTPSEHSLLINEPLRQRYESSWTSGIPLALSECLPEESSSQYLPTLEELAHIQLEFAWKAHASGTRPRPAAVNSLLDEFPALRNPEVLIRLLRQEFDCRTRAGDAPSAEDYRRDFPDLDLDRLTVAPGDTIGPTATDDTATIPPPPADAATIPPPPADAATIPPPPTGSNPSEDQTLQSAVSFVEAATPPEIQLEGYEILGELGRGGMGVVYRALDVRLKRVVALKMILAGVHADPEDLKRFQLEAEAVAQLQHPNIVQIHDVGEHEGKPYFSLEFVEGGELASQIAGEPQPPDEAARLVETLSRAMQFAHERNIVHRDLKPANVLLTADGQPKITDFGLAKRLEDDSGQTASGSIMGTPSYMAPEQAGGHQAQIGPQTDVYALGALLYCLLTGRPPFQSANVMDTVLQVLEQEPVPPRQLVTGLDKNLETITLKCLQKDPARRYQAAEEVAEELRRYLNDEPILARPVGIAERTWRWCRRKPAIAGLCAAVVLLLGFVTVNGYLQAEIQRELTGQALTQKAKANENFNLARGAVDRYMTEVSQNTLLAAPQMEPLRRELLTGAMEFYEKFVKQARDDSDLKSALGKSHYQLAQILITLGEPRKGIESLRRAIDVLKVAIVDDPGSLDLEKSLLNAQQLLGRAYYEVAEFELARTTYLEAIEATKELLKAYPDNPDFLRRLSQINSTLGYNDAALGDDEKALESLQAAVSLIESNSQDQSDNHVASLGNAYGNLASQLHELGRIAEARSAHKKSIELLASLHKDGVAQYTHIFLLATTRNNYGTMLRDIGSIDEAESELRETIRLVMLILEGSPDVVRYSELLAGAYANLGHLLSDSGRTEEAVATYETARRFLEPLVAKHTDIPGFAFSLSRVHHSIGTMQASSEKPEVAQQTLQQAIDIAESVVEQHPDVADYSFGLAAALGEMAGLLHKTNRLAEAEALYDRSLVICQGLLEKRSDVMQYHTFTSRFQMNRGKARKLAGNLDGAGSDFREAIARLNPNVAAHPEIVEFSTLLATSRAALAELCLDNKQFVDAVTEYSAAATIYRMLRKKHPEERRYVFSLACQLSDMAFGLEKTKKFQESETAYTESRKLLGELTAADPNNREFQARLATTDHHIGVLLIKTGDSVQGLKRMNGAATILQSLIKSDPTHLDYLLHLMTVEIDRAQTFINNKQPQPAMVAYQAAIDAGASVRQLQPSNTDNLYRLAGLLQNLASLQVKANQPKAALKNFSQVSDRLRELIPEQPERSRLLLILSTNEKTIGQLSRDLGSLPDAITHQKLSVEALLKLTQMAPNDRQLAIFMANAHLLLAEYFDQAKRGTDADPSYRAAEKLFSSLARIDSSSKFLGNRVAISRLWIGEFCLLQGNHTEAVAMAVGVGQVAASHAPTSQRYAAARLLALAVAVAFKDPKLKPEQKIQVADQYGLAAMMMIKQLEGRKFFTKPKNVKKFLDDLDFKSLEDRKDYQELVKGLKTSSPQSGKTPSTP